MVDLQTIGDCCGDGNFNNFDIDCMVDLLMEDPYCGHDSIVPCGELCAPGGGGESARFGGTPDEWEHFWCVVS
ncbi:MAG: hypothetical protein JNG88_13040 [Phycisphaerales bacterium]|nr:hypothetical protein [Phycisphaerales bacterium]